jgi:hypothetical protein
MQKDGVVSCCGAQYTQANWFSDGYADYLKSFSDALAADPSLAPARQNHLLGSTSVVQRVAYAAQRVAYRTFAKRSVEVLRLSFTPGRVTAGGRPLPRRRNLRHEGFVVRQLTGRDVELRVRHDDARVVVAS